MAAIGLDVGTMFIVASKKENDEIKFSIERDAYLDINPTEFTTQMLNASNVRYVKKGKEVFIVGNSAVEFSNAFKRELKRPLRKGLLSPKEEYAFPLLGYMFKVLIGEGKKEDILCFSCPADPIDRELDVSFHKNVIRSLLSRLGYTIIPVPEALAVVYSELSDSNFTGIGISCGAGMINICCAYKSMPAFSFSLSRGGDWIDQSVASNVGKTASKVCYIKENSFSLTESTYDPIKMGLQIYYENLISYIISNIREQLKKTQDIEFGGEIPIAIAGGTSLVPGFIEKFTDVWNNSNMPVVISEIKHPEDRLYSVSKGCLIVAEKKWQEIKKEIDKKK